MLDSKFKDDLIKFDGNAMALRVLTKTGFDGGSSGMRPTYAVLGALLKYPSTSDCCEKEKFSCLQNEREVLEEVAAGLGLIKISNYKYARHPLAFLTEAADDICYRIIDLEDATEVGILSKHFILDNFKGCLRFNKNDIKKFSNMHFRERNGIIRAKIINHAILECVKVFKEKYKQIMTGKLRTGLLENSKSNVLVCLLGVYKETSKDIFFSRRKVELEIGAQKSLGVLLDTFTGPATDFCTNDDAEDLKMKIESILGKERISQLRPNEKVCFYQIIILILDYISGMTDQYATEMCRKFIGIGG